MRLLCLVLFALVLATLYTLWWGKGGWQNLRELQSQVVKQTEVNQAMMARNAALQAEVQDLATGVAAIEERARNELNMIREEEIYVQIVP